MHFEESVQIARSPEQVRDFFEDLSNLPKWDRGVARVERTSGDGGVGSTFDTVGHRERGRMSYLVTELDPPQQFRVETHSGFFKEAEWHFRLEPVEGGTRVICTTDFTLRPRCLWLAPLLLLVAMRSMTYRCPRLIAVVHPGCCQDCCQPAHRYPTF